MTAPNTGPILLKNIIFCRKNRNKITSQNILLLSRTLGHETTHFSSLQNALLLLFRQQKCAANTEIVSVFF